jgi:hypothetical protein
MKKTFLICSVIFIVLGCIYFLNACQKISAAETENTSYPKALSSYNDFKALVAEVEQHRAQRLVTFNKFIAMSKEPKTIILDTRSADRYEKKHIKGAVHLSFTDFTQTSLNRLIPDPTTRILIYCNNNFIGDQVNFASKTAQPQSSGNSILQNTRPVMLALNIPTYINLYGYGFRNVYELDELVNINDTRIVFEGTEVSN